MVTEAFTPKRRVYARLEHRLFLDVLLAMGAAFFVAAAVSAGPLWAIGALPFALLGYRIWRVGVCLSPEGVVVREVSRSSPLFPWSEIDRFDWGRRGGFPTGGVYLRDGRFIQSFALNPASKAMGPDKCISRLLAELNAELERARKLSASSRP